MDPNGQAMAKTIEGFAVNGSGEIPNVVLFPPDDCPRCVTLVLHDGKHERMFTESEVRAYEKDLMRAQSDPGHFTERYREEKVLGQPYEETVPQWVARARAIVRKAHGLSDPA